MFEISTKNLNYFKYGTEGIFELQNINIQIASGKITAIVGSSESGKNTLTKLLCRFLDSQ